MTSRTLRPVPGPSEERLPEHQSRRENKRFSDSLENWRLRTEKGRITIEFGGLLWAARAVNHKLGDNRMRKFSAIGAVIAAMWAAGAVNGGVQIDELGTVDADLKAIQVEVAEPETVATWGARWGSQGGSWGSRGGSWGSRGGSWGSQGGSWGSHGRAWGSHGGSWGSRGGSWGSQGGSWGSRGGSWGSQGRGNWGSHGGSWGSGHYYQGGSYGSYGSGGYWQG